MSSEDFASVIVFTCDVFKACFREPARFLNVGGYSYGKLVNVVFRPKATLVSIV